MNMFAPETQMFLLDGVNAGAGFAVNWLLQSTLLISIGLIVGALLRSRGSAVQSLVYRTTLIAVLVCPLATVTLGAAGFTGWSVTMPETWAMEVREPAVETDLVSQVAPAVVQEEPLLEPAGESEPFAADNGNFADSVEVTEPLQHFPMADSGELPTEAIEPAAEPTNSPEVAAVIPATESIFTIRTFGVFASLAILTWCLIALVLALRLASAWWKLWRLRRGATKVEPALHLACQQLAVRMEVETPEVYRSPFLPSPCLAGLRNPSILLPEDDCGLSMQDVLIHELAHLRRHDCHWNLLRQIATSVLFFQPLLWILSRKLEITAEEVCDDFVVQFGGDRTDYANRLVGIAELSTAPISAAGVGVVSLRSMLGQRVTRILDTSRTLSTRVGNLILAIVLACGLLGTGMTGMLGLNPAPVNDATAINVDTDSNDESTAGPRFKGQVVDPNGSPVVNAKIYMVFYSKKNGLMTPDAQPVAATDANGNFDFTIDKSVARFSDFESGIIAAVKDGFGMAWCPSVVMNLDDKSRKDDRKEIEDLPKEYRTQMEAKLDGVGKPLRLVHDDQAVTGKILNIEGQPVAGAKLTLLTVSTGRNDTLDQWNAAATEPQADFYSVRQKTPRSINGPQLRSLITPAVSDTEGKFKINGIGNGRIAQLLVEGSGITTEKIYVRTEKGEAVKLKAQLSMPQLKDLTYHPNDFTLIAAPTAEIRGVVEDAKTGKPIVGATIKSQSRHGEAIWGQDFVRTVTDEQGRYRLTGMPIGKDNRIAIVPPDSKVAYLATSRKAPLTSPDSPLKLDIKLHTGVWLEGRVTDKQSGEGLRGYVDHHVIAHNPNFKLAGSMDVDQRYARTSDADGKFRFAILPGPAYVTFLFAGRSQKYARSTHITQNDGSRKEIEKDMYQTSPHFMTPSSSNAILEIDALEDGIQKIAIQLDSSGNLLGKVVDSTGKQIKDFSYTGRLAQFNNAWDVSKKGKLELVGYDEAKGREVYLQSKDRKLAGYVNLVGKQDAEFVATLQPSGSLKGRLLDDDGQPITNCKLTDYHPHYSSPPLPNNRSHSRVGGHYTDSEGHFEIEGLVAGLEYHLLATRRKNINARPDVRRLFKPTIKLKPGESRDLGDVALYSNEQTEELRNGAASSKQPNAPKDKTQSSKTQPTTVSGIVTDPDGNPVSGAKVHAVWVFAGDRSLRHIQLSQHFEHEIIAATRSNSSGAFSLTFSNESPDKGRLNGGWHIVATAIGHGPAWKHRRQLKQNASPTLRLARKEDVRGRILDMEGNPISGVRVSVHSLQTATSEQAIAKWIKDAKTKTPPARVEDYFSPSMSGPNTKYPERFPRQWQDGGLALGSPALPSTVESDEFGRFEFRGLGADRLATIQIEGPSIAKTNLLVVTRKMQPLSAMPTDMVGTRSGVYYGREFDFVAESSQLVEGTVTDVDSGEPIVGVQVSLGRFSDSGWSQHDFLSTRTDEKGNINCQEFRPVVGIVSKSLQSFSSLISKKTRDFCKAASRSSPSH